MVWYTLTTEGDEMSNAQFGLLLKRLRLEQNLSLREFSRQSEYDASNLSKIERGLLPPPGNSTLKAWAKILGLGKDSVEYEEFIDTGHISANRLPSNTPAQIRNVLLPALLRTVRSEKLSKDEYERLVRLLNK
jgi:transcriptional regulator with XRE-family HTH domain